MNNKKLFVLFFFLVISLSFNVGNVLADCSDCNSSNCESCGCVLSPSGSTCVYSNYSDKDGKSCGNITDIPPILPKVTSILYTIIQIAVPIILVIMGMIDLFKSLSAQKEDDMKKGQKLFVKRLISAVIIFFVLLIYRGGTYHVQNCNIEQNFTGRLS